MKRNGNMTRLGVIASDDIAYSYVFINGQCYVTIFDITEGNVASIVCSPLPKVSIDNR